MTQNSSLITGGQLVVREFIKHEIQRLYCVPGESYLAVIDALVDSQQEIAQITCRHESGAGMMALAEAELTGRPAACFVTRGPGATNVSIAVHIAEQASVPLVLCVGQVSSSRLGRESFQEMDYQQFFGDITKSVFNVGSTQEIPNALQHAFTLAQSGRPGPVVVVFPEDILRQQVPLTSIANNSNENKQEFAAEKNQSNKDALKRIECAINESSHPLIIAGGSLWSDTTAAQLQRFAEINHVPVFTAFRRNDVMSNHSACYAGYLGLNQHDGATRLIEQSDCVIVLGARLDEPTTGDYSLPTIFESKNDGKLPEKKWIHIYPEFAAISATPEADITVEMSAASFLDAVCDIGRCGQEIDKSWVKTCRDAYEVSLKDSFSAKFNPQYLDLPLLMRELVSMLPEDVIVTSDAGNFTLWPQRFCQFTRPGRFLAPVNGAMGYGVPAGIAASLVRPQSTVVTFVGDGGMMMTGMEMATAIRHGAKPIIIVFNNSLYGTIDSHQRKQYPGRQHGNDLCNPDFVQFAESFGAAAVRVKTVHDFANAFLQAKQLNELTLIELFLQDEDNESLNEF